MKRPIIHHLAAGAMLLVGCLSGCTTSGSATTRPSNWTQQAQGDPYNYDPKWEQPNISGGGLRNFDKDAFKRDVDHVFNP